VMDDVSRFFGWVFGRFIGPKDEDEPPAAHGAPPTTAPGQLALPLREAAE
jgi:HAE1 family hydrophobic/amphiphilic exporter-1